MEHLVHFGTIGKARCGWELVIAAAASASRVYRSCDSDKFKMLKRGRMQRRLAVWQTAAWRIAHTCAAPAGPSDSEPVL